MSARSGPGTARGEPARYYPTGKRSYARIIATDDIQGAADALLARQLGVHRLYVLNDGESYGIGLATDFTGAASKLELEIVGAGAWNAAARDYKALAAEVKQAGADGVLLAGLFRYNGATLIRDRRAGLGPKVRFMASDGFADFAVLVNAGAAVEDMTISLPGAPTEQLPASGKAFVRAFGRAVGQTPYSYSVYAAEATEVLLNAIARSEGTRASVTAQLFKTKVSKGLVGSFSIDAKGDTTGGAVTIYRIIRRTPTVFRVITPSPDLVSNR